MTDVELSPVQIREIALQSVHFERGAGGSDSEETDYELGLEIGVGFREDDPDEALVKVAVKVDWNTETPPFELSLGYLAFVTHDGSLERENFEKICQSRITVIMLGMLRPFVSRLMSEAKEKFQLPLLDLRKLAATPENQEDS